MTLPKNFWKINSFSFCKEDDNSITIEHVYRDISYTSAQSTGICPTVLKVIKKEVGV